MTAPPGEGDPGPPDGGRPSALSLRSRLSILFALAGVVLVVAAVLSAFSLSQLIDARHQVLNRIDPANVTADQLLLAYVNQETGVRGYVLSANPVFLQPYDQGLAQEATAERRLSPDLVGNPSLQRLVRAAETQAMAWQDSYARPAIAAVAAHRSTLSSEQALLRSKSLFDAVRQRFATLDNALATARQLDQRNLQAATDRLIGILVGVAALLLLVGLALRRSLRVWVTSPLLSLGADARQVAAGDLAHPVEPVGPPELVQLGTDMEAMRQRIAEDLRSTEVSRHQLARLNDELTRSNVELERFAYVASHDLQEPLRKVTSFVQLLQQRYQGRLDERADQYIDFAVDGAKRMQQLINDLLAFSRVGRDVTTQPIELASTVDVALANLASAVEETGASIRVGSMPWVEGDPGLLAIVWQNLIGNALKFHADERPEVAISAERFGPMWRCCIADNGIGIEPRFAERVFVLFQRLHSREEYQGTGIGLALCRKIVEFHGGSIWLDTEHRPGTRICFTLPGAQPPGDAA